MPCVEQGSARGRPHEVISGAPWSWNGPSSSAAGSEVASKAGSARQASTSHWETLLEDRYDEVQKGICFRMCKQLTMGTVDIGDLSRSPPGGGGVFIPSLLLLLGAMVVFGWGSGFSSLLKYRFGFFLGAVAPCSSSGPLESVSPPAALRASRRFAAS